MRPHVAFTDTKGDVHVSPADSIYLDSSKVDSELLVTVELSTDFFNYDVTREEFERLVRILTATQETGV